MGIATVAVYSEADERRAACAAWPTRRCASARRPSPRAISRIDRIVEACKHDRRRGGASRLRVPLRERRVSPARSRRRASSSSGPTPRAIAAMGDKIESKKLAAAGRRRRPCPGHLDADRRRRSTPSAIAREIGYPGDDQGLGRRRRQGHAHRAHDAEARDGFASRRARRASAFGDDRVFIEKIHRGAAPHRDPGARRRARQRRLSWRARMLDPAPPPEGDRGGAEPVPRRRDARRHGRAGGGAGPGRRTTARPARSSSSSTRTATSISSR